MKRTKAIFTLVKNEKYFLQKWVDYYRQHFDDTDIYVFDDNSTDGSTDNLAVKTFKLYHDNCYSTAWMTEQILHIWGQLLKDYKYVMYTDADEFVITKHGDTLKNELNKLIDANTPCIIPTGYNLVHWRYKERDVFDETKPLLSQRNYVRRSYEYSKVVMGNKMLYLNQGQHTASNEVWYSQTQRDFPNLLLIHAKSYDQNQSVERFKQRYNATTKNNTPDSDHFFVLNDQLGRFMHQHFPGQSYNTDTFNNMEHDIGEMIHLDTCLNYDYKNLF